MKTNTFACLTGLVLVTAAQAGTPTTEMAPAPSANLWQWFIGGSVGYLTDQEEAMYGLQLGMEYPTPGTDSSHAIYLEVGFTRDDAGNREPANLPGDIPVAGGISWETTTDLDIIPITLNYKYQAVLADRFNGYVGLGLGVAILDSSYTWSWTQALPPPNDSGRGGGDDSDVVFYGNIFAGVSYDVTESFEIFAGLRYIFMDNKDIPIEFAGTSVIHEAGIDGDLLVELGLRFRF